MVFGCLESVWPASLHFASLSSNSKHWLLSEQLQHHHCHNFPPEISIFLCPFRHVCMLQVYLYICTFYLHILDLVDEEHCALLRVLAICIFVILYVCIFLHNLDLVEEEGIVRCCVLRKKQCFASPSSIIMNSPQFKPKCSKRQRKKEKTWGEKRHLPLQLYNNETRLFFELTRSKMYKGQKKLGHFSFVGCV